MNDSYVIAFVSLKILKRDFDCIALRHIKEFHSVRFLYTSRRINIQKSKFINYNSSYSIYCFLNYYKCNYEVYLKMSFCVLTQLRSIS